MNDKAIVFASRRNDGQSDLYIARLVRKVPAKAQSNPNALSDQTEDSVAPLNRALRFDAGKVTLPVFDWKNTESVTWEATATLEEDKWSHIFLQYGNNWGLELTRDHAGQVQNAVKWSATAKRTKNGEQFRAELRESVTAGRT
jgi:hypothetical protein